MDEERKSKGPRSPLHGIPIVLKDNIDTADLPTTGGSVLLEGSIPPDDAFVVKKLRAAGAVIVAKVNLSEFASGAAHSSLGGQILNPHDLARIAGRIIRRHRRVDRGGVRHGRTRHGHRRIGPGTLDGQRHCRPQDDDGAGQSRRRHSACVELRHRRPDGQERSDVAAMLSAIAGVDPADAVTKTGEGKAVADYTQSLKADALKGARLGIARDFLGQDTDVDWVMEASLEAMRKQGATIVDVRLPKWLLDAKGDYYNAIRYPEFVSRSPTT
jgi:amidase